MFFSKVFLFLSFSFVSLTFGQNENQEVVQYTSHCSKFYCPSTCVKTLGVNAVYCDCDDQVSSCYPMSIKAGSYAYTQQAFKNQSSFFEFDYFFNKVNCFFFTDATFTVESTKMVSSQYRSLDKNCAVYTDKMSDPMEKTGFKVIAGKCDLEGSVIVLPTDKKYVPACPQKEEIIKPSKSENLPKCGKCNTCVGFSCFTCDDCQISYNSNVCSCGNGSQYIECKE